MSLGSHSIAGLFLLARQEVIGQVVWFFTFLMFYLPLLWMGLVLMCAHWGPHFRTATTVNEAFSCIDYSKGLQSQINQ